MDWKYLVDYYNTSIHDNINKVSNDDKGTVIIGDFIINYQSNNDNQEEFKETDIKWFHLACRICKQNNHGDVITYTPSICQ